MSLSTKFGAVAGGGFREPLFDRLAEDAPARLAYGPAKDRGRLIASIERELMQLLNTRRVRSERLDPATATTLDYGIPAFSFRTVAVDDDLRALELLIANAIAVFEPRLLHPAVRLTAEASQPSRAVGYVSGSIRVGTALEEFHFPIGADGQTMEVTAIDVADGK